MTDFFQAPFLFIKLGQRGLVVGDGLLFLVLTLFGRGPLRAQLILHDLVLLRNQFENTVALALRETLI